MSERLDKLFIPHERTRKASETFSKLRKAQLLCLYHFGQGAYYDAIDELFDAKAKVLRAVGLLSHYAVVTPPPPDDERLRLDAWHDLMATGTQHDSISQKIDSATLALEAICAPYFRYRSAFFLPLSKWRGRNRSTP